MSAYYAVIIDDRIELLTDGAIYDDNGVLLDTRQKVWTSPRIPFAVTGRGCSATVDLIAQSFLTFSCMGSVDRALDAIAESLASFDKMPATQFEMVITAISETRGPAIYYLASANHYDLPDFGPLKLYDFGHEIAGGPQLAAAEAASFIHSYDPEQGLRSIAVPLFEVMRRKRGPNPARPDLPDHFGIGGHVDLTVVTSGGCTVECLHTWDDVIGKPIDPNACRDTPESVAADIALMESLIDQIEQALAQQRKQPLARDKN